MAALFEMGPTFYETTPRWKPTRVLAGTYGKCGTGSLGCEVSIEHDRDEDRLLLVPGPPGAVHNVTLKKLCVAFEGMINGEETDDAPTAQFVEAMLATATWLQLPTM